MDECSQGSNEGGGPMDSSAALVGALVMSIAYPCSGLGQRWMGRGVGRCWWDLGGNGLHRFLMSS